VVAAVLTVALLTACGERGEAVFDTTGSSSTPVAAATAGPASPVADADIIALLDRANATDSAAGALAVSKASGSELRSFAAQMVRDHHAMRLEGERVAKRLRVASELADSGRGGANMAAILAVLNSTARGGDFDKAYIDHEVAFHLDFLETVTGAMQRAGETELSAYIQKLAPLLEEHLDRAQALQARLR
jgi:putative membrane protein